MDFVLSLHPTNKHSTMTNRELLQASVLDIVFEHRNKDYGAYELRRQYEKRLWLALGITFALLLVFATLPSLKRSKAAVVPVTKEKPAVVIREVYIRPQPPKEPEPVKPRAASAPKAAARKYTSQIQIKPDLVAKPDLPDMADLGDKQIDVRDVDGPPATGPAGPSEIPSAGTGSGPLEPASVSDFEAREVQPEFPGGEAALHRFLASQLQSPEELASGERKIVRVRFVIGKDGIVAEAEILSSGGPAFDREVVRVMRKMPRWKPASQNGIPVAVSYLLPVTFVGME